MCGISGYINIKGKVDVSVLKEMTDIVDYRGPDDEGFVLINETCVQYAKGKDTVKEITYPPIEQYIDKSDIYVGLGHRRLSIRDLSIMGHQPMEKHGKILVFNGEIYNSVELRAELEEKGYHFFSHCDTEVILSAYDYWGKGCVDYFNGMWAFTLYDCKNKEIFLSRDRFGVKPLYYYYNEDTFIFASEIKQILCDSTISPVVNEEILAHYLRYNFREYSNETFFQNIFALQGGHNMTLQLDYKNQLFGEMRIWKYYDLRHISVKPDLQQPDQLVGRELRRAIQIRLRSDVKVGSCLSGGMDSSSIVGLIYDEYKKDGMKMDDFSTVTSYYPNNKEIDETYWSKLVVKRCGCEENLVTPDVNTMLNNLKKIVWHQDEPIPHLGIEVSYAVFQRAAERGCKVFFDGQGGDEGLGGYYFYYANYLLEVLKEKGMFQFIKTFKEVINSSGFSAKSLAQFILYFNFPLIRHVKTAVGRNKYMSKRVLKAINEKDVSAFFIHKDTVGRQIDDFLFGSLPGILHWEDRNSMASSVETRLPFLDYRYVEKVLSIGIERKINAGYTKVPLRNYMKDILPEEVVWRKNKMGFPAPHRAWLRQMPSKYILDLLDNAVSAPLFNIDVLKKSYLKKKGKLDMVEKFIAVELWMRTFHVQVN